MICLKMKNCCCGSASISGSNTRIERGVDANKGDDYVGGMIQMEKRQDGESERELI